jgi:hypothetical protein
MVAGDYSKNRGIADTFCPRRVIRLPRFLCSEEAAR